LASLRVFCDLDSSNIAGSGKDHDAEEQAFFLRLNWNKIDENLLGVASLRDQLSLVLFEQMREELPRLIEDIEKGISISVTKLQKLGRG
jgi:formyltetrahydrofolate hydrolase